MTRRHCVQGELRHRAPDVDAGVIYQDRHFAERGDDRRLERQHLIFAGNIDRKRLSLTAQGPDVGSDAVEQRGVPGDKRDAGAL